MNKRGMTLMELLVYMAIVGIVVVVAGTAFTNSTKMRVRTQGMIKANQVAEDAASLMRDDIAQMGAKSAKTSTGATNFTDAFIFDKDAYIDAENTTESLRDSSSFVLDKRSSSEHRLDSLALRRIAYTDAGEFLRVEEVSWYVEDEILTRACKTITAGKGDDLCPEDEPAVMNVTENVVEFKVTPSKSNVTTGEALIFPNYAENLSNKAFRLIPYFNTATNYQRVLVDPPSGDVSVRLASFTTNYSEEQAEISDPIKHLLFVGENGSTSGAWNEVCKSFTFKKDSTYEISFSIPSGSNASKMFQPEVDHLSVGLRKISEAEPTAISDVPDFFFYPPENERGGTTRTMLFSTHLQDETACVAFSFVFYSPSVGAGSMTIRNLEVKQVGTHYTFDDAYNPSISEKKNIKALRMNLVTKNKGEFGGVEFVIPVPSNGVRG